jgi:AraC-like DNA-binding protein
MSIKKLEIQPRFLRTPGAPEEGIGLWVDRILYEREAAQDINLDSLRILGLYSLVYVSRGELEFISSTTGRKILSAGTAFVLFPEIPHRYCATTDGCIHSAVLFNGTLARHLHKLGYMDEKNPFYRDESGAVVFCVRKISDLMNKENIGSHLERMNLVINALLSLNSQKNCEVEDRNRKICQEICRRLEDNLTEDIAIEKLVNEFHLSYSQLRRIFKQETGSTIKQQLVRNRISAAKELLINSDLTLELIAKRCGFEDVFYFMQSFKKSTGMTAGQFRGVTN